MNESERLSVLRLFRGLLVGTFLCCIGWTLVALAGLSIWGWVA